MPIDGEATITAAASANTVRHGADWMRYGPRVTIGVLLLALIGSLAWGASNKNDLDATRTALASTTNQLDSTKAALTSERQTSDALSTDNTQLRSQVDRQKTCLAELRAEQTDFNGLISRNSANFNATANGSTYATARVDQINALVEALDDYQKAWTDAYDGNYSSSITWAKRGNTAYQRGLDDATTMTAEIAKVNTETAAIDSAVKELTGRLSAAAVTCGFSDNSTGSSS